MPNKHGSVCSHIIAPTIAGPEIAGLVLVTQTLCFLEVLYISHLDIGI